MIALVHARKRSLRFDFIHFLCGDFTSAGASASMTQTSVFGMLNNERAMNLLYHDAHGGIYFLSISRFIASVDLPVMIISFPLRALCDVHRARRLQVLNLQQLETWQKRGSWEKPSSRTVFFCPRRNLLPPIFILSCHSHFRVNARTTCFMNVTW